MAGLRVAVVLATCLVAELARGESPGTDPVETAKADEERTRWYGWQVLMVDGFNGALLVAAHATDTGIRGEHIVFAATTYVLGGSVVHLAHLRVPAALGSVGLRVGLPVAGGALGFGICALRQTCLYDGTPYFLAIIGLAVAPGLDIGLLSHEVVDEPALSMTVAPMAGGMALELGGAF